MAAHADLDCETRTPQPPHANGAPSRGWPRRRLVAALASAAVVVVAAIAAWAINAPTVGHWLAVVPRL
jgi:hypothetical protein